MSTASLHVTKPTLQKLLIKRFALSCATYAMVLLLVWVAFLANYLRLPPGVALTSSALVVASQAGLYAVFHSGLNRRFRDPGLTQFQVVLAIAWQTWLLACLDEARGTFLVLYLLILLFGLFHLPRPVFIRCAVLVFVSFTGLNLWDAYRMVLIDPGLAVLQACALFVVLLWLCLYASYVQASRQRMRQRGFALQAHQDTLRGMMRQLEELVATDELTGLFNRRHFLRRASRELAALRTGTQHGLALIDLDYFKRINDVHGHAAGDQVLQVFASVAKECLRDADILARYGGEEFVLLLPESDSKRLVACCERLRQAFSGAEIENLQLPNLSLSIGMTLLQPGDDLDAALHRADQALYRAKRGGRNRCAAAWEAADA